ncbi:hypothetical protein [Paenibacillus sp. GXUN7292]
MNRFMTISASHYVDLVYPSGYGRSIKVIQKHLNEKYVNILNLVIQIGL